MDNYNYLITRNGTKTTHKDLNNVCEYIKNRFENPYMETSISLMIEKVQFYD